MAGAAGVILVLASVLIGRWVLAPHELLTRPTKAYPGTVTAPAEQPFGELRAAPLVVDGQLRVYAERWRVWSDAPVGGRYEATPYWALRRWPAEVVGVVAVRAARAPVVVTHWSDGKVLALDARRGEIAWRAAGPRPGRGYAGRRTGARAVYQPDTLLTAGAGSRAVVAVRAVGEIRVYDAGTGQTLWRRAVPEGCRAAPWAGLEVLAVPDCFGREVVLLDADTGGELRRWRVPGSRAEPALCVLGRSGCALVTVNGIAWRLADDGTLIPVPPPETGARLAGDRVVYPTPVGVSARRLTGAGPLWTWRGAARLVAADQAGVYLITDDMLVLALHPATGHVSGVGCARSSPTESWRLGYAYSTGDGRHVVLERLAVGAKPTDDDRRYFHAPRPVALVELHQPTRLPVWSGRLAACRPSPSG